MLTLQQPALLPFVAESARCRAAQRAWAALSIAQRLRPIRCLRHLLARESDVLCTALAADVGKTNAEALATEVLPLADACRFLELEAARLLRPKQVPTRLRPLWMWGQHDTVHRRPRGLIGLIGTWNYPVFLNGVQLVQSLTAGNGVLWKPSELASASATALFGLFQRAGFPEGLIELLEPTRENGPALAESDLDHVVFTGAASTGAKLAATLGRRLISSTLELSGCDAMFVLADADVSHAARAAWFGVTLNGGQTCLAVRRIFVHRTVYDAFETALMPLINAGRPQHLALADQVRHAEKLVQDAMDYGATVLQTPAPVTHPKTANDCLPCLLLDSKPEMAFCMEASFAPLAAVVPFGNLDEALKFEAGCPFALGASIFSRNRQHAEDLAARLRAGAVTINDVIVPTAHPATPFGGRGMSGWGVTQGAEGLLEMTIPQVVSNASGTLKPQLAKPEGITPAQGELIRGILAWQHGQTRSERWGGLLRLVRGGWKR